ncbi:M48 family metallopeptidase [Methanosphaera sp. ISO3-F5]|uniref:M48 family metallopeptidase n=1 Tax=Methanosphaera sp. ISO3-F5 TaxID=1452353 RepID=UPI002B25CAF8|nr:M48 family metallopeptidase [Methanosphaera sp. ISO3-F5]WQH64382.1 M48 family metallopeptidase [Methanosphaera sp. ISO3-F5]
MKFNEIKINDIIIEYYVEYRNVKYIRYELRDGVLRLVLPKRSKINVEEQIHKKDKWLYKKIKQYRKNLEKNRLLTSDKKLENRSLIELKYLVNGFVEEYEKKLNVNVNRIQYRSMVHKWGSCSSLRNITLSKDLRFLPDALVRYIVYHEMSHIIVMAHNDKFYELIKKEFENYKKYDEELEQYLYLINKNN